MLFKVIKSMICAVAVSTAIVCTVQAKDYNQGFLAAEGGDYKSAVDQWRPLAEKGHPIAQFNLALLYHSGLGVDLNEATAVSWYKKSASNGYYKAQEYLAVGYREGWFGLPKDIKQAKFWEKRLEENAR